MAVERNFEYYRSQFFANPDAPVDSRFANSSTTLFENLVGIPDVQSSMKADDELGAFTNSLVADMSASRFFNHLSIAQLHPNGNMPAELAHIASTLRNNNTINGESGPVESAYSVAVVSWLLREIAHFDEESASGALTSGGTLANITGLMIAREKLVHEQGWNGTTPAKILTTEMSHYSIEKAARLLAPAEIISTVPVPLEAGGYKMDTDALVKQIDILRKEDTPIMAVVAVAGETETGLVDPLEEIATIAKERGIYLHVDGAYGGPFVLSKRGAIFDGMQEADSLTIDPHKYLYTPYPAGSILFKEQSDHAYLAGFNEKGERYVLNKSNTNHGKLRIEGSMGGQSAAATYAVIQTLGVEGLRYILDHTIDLTDYGYKKIVQSPYFRPAFEPELNSLCFFPDDKRVSAVTGDPSDQKNLIEEARKELEDRTGVYITTTEIPSPETTESRKIIPVFRMVPTHPYTEPEHIDYALDNLEEIWDETVSKFVRKAL